MSPSHERKTNIKENNSKWAPKPSTYYKHTGAPNVNTIKKNNLLDKHWVKPGVKCKRCSQGVASCISFVVFAWVCGHFEGNSQHGLCSRIFVGFSNVRCYRKQVKLKKL